MKRISSIDCMRGLVMVIMALDHVRDFMHTTSLTQSPTNLQTTTAVLFFTRWITHLCAPTFVFLAGISAYISFKSDANISRTRKFLLSRGIWLIILEFTVINFALWFDIHFRTLILEVIFATGAGFIVLSLLLKLPSRITGIIGLILIFSHDLLLNITLPANPVLNFLFSALFRPNAISVTPHFSFIIAYPLIPWLGILLAGFSFGKLFELSSEKRRKIFLQTGIAALVLFCGIRFINIYGDPSPWSIQKTNLFTFLSFINTTKYPLSLLFTLLFTGIMLILFSFAENTDNRLTRIFCVYGKVPLFYFIIHLYLIHLLMLVMVFIQGFHFSDLQFGLMLNGRPEKDTGISLPVVYIVWICVVASLYPLCKWYGKYKAAHKNNLWLRYL